jgi:phospholipid-transporting ATPase
VVEDRLQDEVPNVIRDLIDVNVKVWMLTGDKLETAENIAFSCKLIQPGFERIYLKNFNLSKENQDEEAAFI